MAGMPVLVMQVLVVALLCIVASAVATLHPLSEAEKVAAKQLFVVRDDGSFGSLEETYQAVKSLKALKSGDLDGSTICEVVSKTLTSSSSAKDAFYGIRIAELLHCQEAAKAAETVVHTLLDGLKESKSLVDLHYTVGALSTIKKHHWSLESHSFAQAVTGIISQVKALGENHGTWRYAEDETDSSAKAAGYAFEITAAVIDIAGYEGHEAEVKSIKSAALKLLENSERDDDGAQYFDENKADKFSGSGGALVVSATVLRGVTALAGVLPDGIKVREEKVFGFAHFFLSIGTPDSALEVYYQLDALSALEDNRVLVPLAVSLTKSVLSHSSHDKLEVAVSTVLGTPFPHALLTIISAHKVGKEASPVLTEQELQSVEGDHIYTFPLLTDLDVGKYDIKIEVKPATAELSYKYSAGGLTSARITVTGQVSVSNVAIAVLDSDTGSPEFTSSLVHANKEKATLSANHLQKLRLTFELTSPSGGLFLPQQVFFKVQHESGVEHLFVVKSSAKKFEINLDFLGLVEKFYYLSGAYSMELIVGDATMENSFLWALGTLDLDLPEAPEGVSKVPAVPVDATKKFGPKAEIVHIFRQPEKRPPAQLSNAFFILTLLPLVGFVVGLRYVGANIKNLPTSGLPLLSTLGFHGGIAAILTLYFFFWLKLNLFITLKVLGFLGVFTCVTGYLTLSHVAEESSKVKMA
ncbi:dolichyl-diphosphooligosaccharide---protein glycosyltransferase subunit 2 (ribophorin II) [Marchantia polymorpha subsp. ruderalis]|uniref:Dolichyl-diphosphooligosaccharide--protein glycosyltransferase subunit 2 n=2 Tax=Marchantia polymorpha TaxID=3197 RepID=A0A176WLM7_MARPO|nr:hypothetical protein AXG93_3105s1190 [Marchantia polymorpha subsp. ruderalis]PTQ42822.1 hypothetical protein MARPO_0028s0115 [Marchantia polymorpha]BBN00575.1 hypothetical protein Mp_2g00360 [Marchantia polymorpha subsp. ruderalis]|eukprot:PTQ42822.1 hypothetical protein MARPO_0028s0115 [Marchantia polymorpha]